MKIFITRHSKTLWNQEKKLQGWKDSPLTKEGINDALLLKRELKIYQSIIVIVAQLIVPNKQVKYYSIMLS